MRFRSDLLNLRVVSVFGILLVLLVAAHSMTQYSNQPEPIELWPLAFLLLLLCLGFILAAMLTAILRRWRASITALVCAALSFSAIYPARFFAGYGEMSRFAEGRSFYLAQIAKHPVIKGERVVVFHWTANLNMFGPAFLLYDQSRAIEEGKFPASDSDGAEWEKQVAKTDLNRVCPADIGHLDARKLGGGFYVVGCEDAFD